MTKTLEERAKEIAELNEFPSIELEVKIYQGYDENESGNSCIMHKGFTVASDINYGLSKFLSKAPEMAQLIADQQARIKELEEYEYMYKGLES